MATRKTLASLSFVALLAASVSAEPVYVNSVAALTNAVATATDGATIVLRATGEPYMFTDEWMDASGTVKNMLVINAKNVTIEGEDSSSRKTWATGSEPVIINANGLGRIVFVKQFMTGATFKNITFTGGTADYGGAVSAYNSSLNPTFTNCVFRQNSATSNGSVANGAVLRDCLVVGNLGKPTMYGGKAYDCDILQNLYGVSFGADFSGCEIRMNSTSGENLISGGNLAVDCVFECNTNSHNNGKFFSGNALTNCVFRKNYASGGGVSVVANGVKSLYKCTFEENSTGCPSVYLNVNGVASTAEDCTFVSNVVRNSSYGGAIGIKRESSKLCSMSVTNCTFSWNKATGGNGKGGAIYALNSVAGEPAWESCTVVDSTFTSNSATCAAGVYGVKARKCTFDGNIRLYPQYDWDSHFGNAAAKSYLEDCDINEGDIAECIVDRCRIHDLPNVVRQIFREYTRVTNSLVECCTLHNSGTLYYAPYHDFDAEFVNCTFVTNKMYTYASTSSATVTNGILFANCIFNGNYVVGYSTDMDVYRGSSPSDIFETTMFANTYYGTLDPYFTLRGNIDVAKFAAKTNAPNALMQCANPRFAQNPKWSLSLRSPILGKGAVADWMDESTDLAGKSRIRDGAVDPGCYQCWLRPLGMIMLIK